MERKQLKKSQRQLPPAAAAQPPVSSSSSSCLQQQQPRHDGVRVLSNQNSVELSSLDDDSSSLGILPEQVWMMTSDIRVHSSDLSETSSSSPASHQLRGGDPEETAGPLEQFAQQVPPPPKLMTKTFSVEDFERMSSTFRKLKRPKLQNAADLPVSEGVANTGDNEKTDNNNKAVVDANHMELEEEEDDASDKDVPLLPEEAEGEAVAVVQLSASSTCSTSKQTRSNIPAAVVAMTMGDPQVAKKTHRRVHSSERSESTSSTSTLVTTTSTAQLVTTVSKLAKLDEGLSVGGTPSSTSDLADNMATLLASSMELELQQLLTAEDEKKSLSKNEEEETVESCDVVTKENNKTELIELPNESSGSGSSNARQRSKADRESLTLQLEEAGKEAVAAAAKGEDTAKMESSARGKPRTPAPQASSSSSSSRPASAASVRTRSLLANKAPKSSGSQQPQQQGVLLKTMVRSRVDSQLAQAAAKTDLISKSKVAASCRGQQEGPHPAGGGRPRRHAVHRLLAVQPVLQTTRKTEIIGQKLPWKSQSKPASLDGKDNQGNAVRKVLEPAAGTKVGLSTTTASRPIPKSATFSRPKEGKAALSLATPGHPKQHRAHEPNEAATTTTANPPTKGKDSGT
ncbi:hypothetical protein HDE_12628 [Halotydeus destructor]|nr:hypothetical protein HDE_12628 [Halotydeus destructor]